MACRLGRLLLVVALLAIGSRGAQSQGDELSLTHRVLLITTEDHKDWATSFLDTILEGYGVPYTTLTADALPAGAAGVRSLLWDTPGAAAKFSALVMHPDVETIGSLSQAQIRELQDFQRRSGARALKFGAPPASLGMQAGACAAGKETEAMRFTSSTPYGVSGVRPDAVLSFQDIWRCPAVDGSATGQCCAKASDSTDPLCTACNVLPVLRSGAPANAAPAGGRKSLPAAAPPAVQGALINSKDGRQALSFTLDCSDEAAACIVLGHLGLAWALQNVIPGQRRTVLSLQVDDIFLSTDNLKGGKYRTTPDDLRTHATWQDQINSKLPPGSLVRAELVFNGNGVLAQVESPDTIQNVPACFATKLYADLGCTCWGKAMADCTDTHWFCRSCVKDWKRVRGSPGAEYTPPPSVGSWNDYTFTNYDDLYRAVKQDRRVSDGFFWVSHTFSHQMLDNVTLTTMQQQIDLNKKMAGDLYLGLAGRPNFSPSSMVTPAISGLFNGDALAALQASGITTVVGDNTWPKLLLNPVSPYNLMFTTEATNGFPSAGLPAIAIMPRWATAMPYTASTADEALETYNAGAPPAERVASFQDLLKMEAGRVVKDALLALRHDGHMFHQANMRVVGSGGPGSLLMMWAEAVLSHFLSYVDWPVRSVKLDDLSQLYLERQARDDCQLSYRLVVSRGAQAVRSVEVRAAGAPGGGAPVCAAPLIVREGVNLLAAGAGAPNTASNANVRAAGASASDGSRTVFARVPAKGSATLRVLGDLPWRMPA